MRVFDKPWNAERPGLFDGIELQAQKRRNRQGATNISILSFEYVRSPSVAEQQTRCRHLGSKRGHLPHHENLAR